ncbi:MAG: methyl-accepting chemotaxis protein [Armatimonadetes bacterium]|nr:methyl-accepting chemotaxis protein [Armatimonadota bacterium]
MWFKNLKVGKKLALAFGAICAMMGILVGLTFYNQGIARESVDRLYTDGVQGTENITKLYANTGEDRSLLYEMLNHLNTEGKVPEELDARMEKLDVQRDEIWNAYDVTVVLPDDKANWAELNTIFDEYKGVSEEIEALMDKGKGAEGLALANSKLAPIFHEKLTPKLQEMVQWNVDQGSLRNDQIMSFFATSRNTTIIVSLISFAIAIFFARITTKSVVSPLIDLKKQLASLGANCITGLANSIGGLQNGDLCGEVMPVTNTVNYDAKDEIGEICQIFDTTLKTAQSALLGYNDCLGTLRGVMSEIDAQANGVAASSQQLAGSATTTTELANSTGETMNQVGHAVNETSSTSEQIAIGAQKLAAEAQDASNAVDSLTQAIEGVLAATQEQGSITEEASEIAGQGGEAVKRTISSMGEIESKVSACAAVIQDLGQKQAQIGNIVQTIDDIASQTNLLALNAAIEAARAGEHGKGFAVVAEEVRKLAERCANATQEISDLIGSVSEGVNQSIVAMEESMEKVADGTSFSGEAREALEGIINAVSRVQDSANQNAKLVKSMSQNAGVVEGTVGQVAAISQQTAAGAQELSASSEEMSASVEEVNRSVGEQVGLISEMSAMSQELAATAETLKVMMSKFRYDMGMPSAEVSSEEYQQAA